MTNMTACPILVVEDGPTNRTIITAHLRRAGFEDLIVAEDGQQALAALEERTPDLVLLDILMPVLDGFATCRALRRDRRWSDLPVLAMTGLEQADERARIFAAGATDLILKPINSAELIARITSHLQNRMLIRSLRELNERTTAELAAARQMQETLLPGTALLAQIEGQYGVSLASRFAPSTELAGDLWGAWPIDAERFGLFALDVVGHGTIAAINAFRIHTLLWQGMTDHADPGRFLESLNRKLRPLLAAGQFATMFYAVLDVARDRIDYAAAGYTSPVIGNGAATRLLDGSGLPLGITQDARYETRTASWMAGEALLLYSDALSEAEAPGQGGSLLGEEGAQCLCTEALRTGSAPLALERLAGAIRADAGLDDDLTLVCVMR
ncbi:Response regulator [Rhodovastum atsumiense]|nr:Response regulator [Rhodovastum atsumiense]